jgi:hypothetical protein
MTVKKKTLSFDEGVWAAVERRALEVGTTPSAYVNNLVVRSERIHRGLQAAAEWEAEHGALSAEELAWADRALDQAHAEAGNGPAVDGSAE